MPSSGTPRSAPRHPLPWLLLLMLLLSGCAEVHWFGQASRGHVRILAAREPLAEVIADPATDPALADALRLAQEARSFAVRTLALPDNASYRSYADLGREHVLWNVFAAPELSLTPVRSCFPVVGCLAYRGWFDEADARAFAEQLVREGNDVYLGGVSAYSTLGWFDDPIVSPMAARGPARLVEVMFHELVHQRLYFAGDSAFNEALATAVAKVGVTRFLGDHAPELLADWQTRERRGGALTALLLETRAALETTYTSPLPDEAKRRAKQSVFAQLATRYEALKGDWGGYAGYDRYMSEAMNNAKLGAVATYEEQTPPFERLLERLAYDFDAFFRMLEPLAPLDPAQRAACLAALATGAEACDA